MNVAWDLGWGGIQGTKPYVFGVRWLQQAMKGRSCVRRLRLRSFHVVSGDWEFQSHFVWQGEVFEHIGRLLTKFLYSTPMFKIKNANVVHLFAWTWVHDLTPLDDNQGHYWQVLMKNEEWSPWSLCVHDSKLARQLQSSFCSVWDLIFITAKLQLARRYKLCSTSSTGKYFVQALYYKVVLGSTLCELCLQYKVVQGSTLCKLCFTK